MVSISNPLLFYPYSYPLLREARVINTTDKDRLISSIVWSKYWNEITFLPVNITKPTEHLFAKWKENQKPKIADMKDDPEEEHFVVEEYEDGFTEFHDTKNGQHGFLHPKETFITINKDGDVFMQSIKKLTFHNKYSDLMLETDSESGDVTFKTKGKTDSTIEKDVVKAIKGKQAVEVAGDASFTYKANWKIAVTGDAEIKTTGTLDIKSSGPCTVESSAMTTVKGSSMVVVDAPILQFKGNKSMGMVSPSGSGVLCAMVACPPCGIPLDERQVVAISMVIFDFFSKEHGLNRRERILLEIAALLHDIGMFIKGSSHHKHGQYIIANSEIFGLRQEESDVIANVVRYHREESPSAEDVSYIALQSEERVLVGTANPQPLG